MLNAVEAQEAFEVDDQIHLIASLIKLDWSMSSYGSRISEDGERTKKIRERLPKTDADVEGVFKSVEELLIFVGKEFFDISVQPEQHKSSRYSREHFHDSSESINASLEQVKGEFDDANHELENLEKRVQEAQSKIERLTAQRENDKNEMAFLREDHDADKIKIDVLESLLMKTLV